MRFLTFLLFTLSIISLIGGFAAEAPAQQKSSTTMSGSYSESAPYQPRQFPPPESKSKKKKSKQADTASPQTEAQTPAPAPISAAAIQEKPVLIPVSVFDSAGNFIPDLKPSDFQVLIDNNEVKITAVENQNEPVNLALLIDTSPSTTFSIELIQRFAESVVGQLRPGDRVMVVTFSEKLQVLAEFTDDREKIRKAIENVKFGDGTSLYGTVRYLFEEKLATVDGKRAVVLFTDGVDTTSRIGYAQSLVYAEKSDVTIFPIYFDTSKDITLARRKQLPSGLDAILASLPITRRGATVDRIKNEYETGKFYLTDLALLSGGQVIPAESFKKNSPRLGEELRRRYLITVAPGSTAPPGQRKEVRVRVNRPNLTVLAKGSYIVPEQ